MKLLHKQLLATCTPYLVLAVLTWTITNGFLERIERQRLRADAQEAVKLHAALLRQNILRLTGQLRLMADLPAFQSGDFAKIQAELQRLNVQQAESFAALYFHTLQLRTLAADGTNVFILSPQDDALLTQGETVVTDIRQPNSKVPPVVYVAVPVTNKLGNPLFALAGELPLTSFCPLLDPNLVHYTGNYSLTDFQGKEYTAGHIQQSSPPNQRANQVRTNLILQSHEIERISTSIPPWNWQLNHFVTFPLQLSALRFQRDQLVSMSIMFMLLAAAGIFWIDRRTARRLATLAETIQCFGAGEPMARSQDQSSDELGKLAEAFNCMAEDIAHANRKLQKQLAEHERSPNLWKQQHEELRAKNAELERFASTAAHELKAPLVTMRGFAKGLEPAAKAGDWDRFHDDVQRIQQAGQDLSAMVDGLLQLAKAGQGVALTNEVSLQQAASDAVELLRGVIDSQRIHIVISPDLPTVKGDPVLWRHVFQNLIDNAIQACDGVASPMIEISCEPRDGQTVCYVRDNGIGIDPQEKDRIFEMFAQGRGKSDGLGFGLALVKKIIELHGGNVWAEDRESGSQITWSVGS